MALRVDVNSSRVGDREISVHLLNNSSKASGVVLYCKDSRLIKDLRTAGGRISLFWKSK